jgi:hypothetical protein
MSATTRNSTRDVGGKDHVFRFRQPYWMQYASRTYVIKKVSLNDIQIVVVSSLER